MVSVKRISSSGASTSKLRRRERVQSICTWSQISLKFSILLLVPILVIYVHGSVSWENRIEGKVDPPQSSSLVGPANGGRIKPVQVSTADSSKLNPILTATVHLVNIHVTKIVSNKKVPTYYDGVEAEFCELEWGIHKENPASVPKYRDLLNKGDDCRKNRIAVNLRNLMEKIRSNDDMPSNRAHIQVLDPKFIFHESRAGSTLLANSLAHFDPLHSRVYSEAGPPLTALKICGENYENCSRETAMQVFKDVMYLMVRVPSISERRVFFKMQPAATTSIDIVLETFPMSPWIFLYRDPEEVLVSHFTTRHVEWAKCLVSKRHPPHYIQSLLDRFHLNAQDVTNEEYCAMYLSAICEHAIGALQQPSRGMRLARAFNYENILDKLIVDILPNHFNVPLSSEEISRIRSIGKIYSKAGGGTRYWSDDSRKKHDLATSSIHQASNDYLAFSYVQLEDLADQNQ